MGSSVNHPKSLKKLDDMKKEEFLELYCAGRLTGSETCEELSIPLSAVYRWRKEDIAFAEAYDMVDRYHKMKRQKNTKKLKQAFLHSFEQMLFNVAQACRACGINRARLDLWKEQDEEFAEAFFDAIETKKDFIEGQLMENVRKGETLSVLFACKTQLKDRGYVEKQQIEHGGQFGVMLSPGTNDDKGSWAQQAERQQDLLARKTIELEESCETGKGELETNNLGAAGRQSKNISKLSHIRSAVRRDAG